MSFDSQAKTEGLAAFARRFVPGLQMLESLGTKPAVVEQVVGMDELGRLRRQMLLHEAPVVVGKRARVGVLVPGPGIYEVRGALLECDGRTCFVGLAFIYVAARGSRLFDRAEVDAVARTLDTPRRPGRPRQWLRRRAVEAEAVASAQQDDGGGAAAPGPGLIEPAPPFAALGVGDVVYLRCPRWGHEVRARAVCYETFELAERPGRAFVFADGLTVGCDAEEFDRHFGFLRHEPALAGLRFRDPRELSLAVAQGRLGAAFEADAGVGVAQ